jgi:hypothetical protein
MKLMRIHNTAVFFYLVMFDGWIRIREWTERHDQDPKKIIPVLQPTENEKLAAVKIVSAW